jgi:gas vesicle protein
MAGENGYGEEGYTVMGMDHYTVEEGHSRLWGVLSFFLGSVVGAGIALLLTPQTGSETRQLLKEASLDAKDKAGVYLNRASEKMAGAATRGKDLFFENRPLLTAAIEAGREAYKKEKGRRMGDTEGSI